jgi:hypothetical protein
MSDRDNRDPAWWETPVAPRASGIIRRRTAFLRKSQAIPRPPKLWRPRALWGLWVLLFGVALGAAATLHRRALDARFAARVVRGQSVSFEIQRIRRDLAALDLDEKTLERELAARLAAAEVQQSEEFYLVLEPRAKRMSLRLGDRIVREAPLAVGAPRPIVSASGERFPAARLSGSFTVRQKLERPAWKPPAWVWQNAGLPVPAPLPEMRGGLGRYVVVLAEDVVLHSPPPPESPLKGARPGSFEAPEEDLGAIWKRIGPETRVYVF